MPILQEPSKWHIGDWTHLGLTLWLFSVVLFEIQQRTGNTTVIKPSGRGQR